MWYKTFYTLAYYVLEIMAGDTAGHLSVEGDTAIY
jgi:hypothetical protein